MSIRWIARVWETSPYKGERLLLHLALADFANDEGVCWPSQTTLARKARVSHEFIRLALKQMTADGLLEVERLGGGRGLTGVYRLKPPTAKGVSQSGETPNRDSLIPLTNRQEPLTLDADFETWWGAYPRKVGKAGARREYGRLAAAGRLPSVDVLVATTERYARQITDLKYCPHPERWLNEERWTDDAAPPPSANVEFTGLDRTAVNLAAAYLNTNRSEHELADAIAHLPPDAQQLALTYYRDRRPQ